MMFATGQQRSCLKLRRKPHFGEVSNSAAQNYFAASSATSDDCGQIAALYARAHLNGCGTVFRSHGSGRGGARNLGGRESDALSAAGTANLTAAAAHAEAIGLPFTRMVTIHWEAAGVPLAGMPKATGRYIDLMTRAIARHGGRTAWLWTHENGDGKGGHCHLLVHVPAALVPVLIRTGTGLAGQDHRRPLCDRRHPWRAHWRAAGA